jgi:hypothetical protein
VNKGLIPSVALFAISCCLPALEFQGAGRPNDVMLGLRALAVGWSGIFAGVLAWYANPIWLIGIFFAALRKPGLVLIATIIALGLACTVFSAVGRELPGDEGNVTKTTISRLLPGCFVWMASLAALPLAAMFPKGK